MLNFCTLFNSNYLSRGIVMYESLQKNCRSFHLYVFAFDKKTEEILKSLNYFHLTVISLTEFEDPELLRVKPTRSATEYCWTCTPSTILYCIQKFNLSNCTYIDADLEFYTDPVVLIDEMKDDSVLITKHRYTSVRDLTEGSGIYCVQFVTFKNDEKGLQVLNWWRNACLEWCYARYEDGKFGDQKYLDDWTERFKGVHVLEHLGGGLAPWNIQQYSFSNVNGKISGKEISTGQTFEAIFYHFHGVVFYDNNIVSLTSGGYELSSDIKQTFYRPYIRLLEKKKKELQKIDNSFNPSGSAGNAPMKPLGAVQLMKFYWYEFKKSPKNIFSLKFLKRVNYHHFHRITHF